MEKKIKAVKMTREIRDEIYEETKNMTDEELIEFFNKNKKTELKSKTKKAG